MVTLQIFQMYDLSRMDENGVVKIYDADFPDESKLLVTYRRGQPDPSFVVTTGSVATVTFESENGQGINFGYIAGNF